ncbi:MAG: serine hydrolase [Patescibacteria group bacterium]
MLQILIQSFLSILSLELLPIDPAYYEYKAGLRNFPPAAISGVHHFPKSVLAGNQLDLQVHQSADRSLATTIPSEIIIPTKVKDANFGPFISSKHAVIFDLSSGYALYAKDGGTPAPIGSITKLVAGLVFVRLNPELTGTVMIKEVDQDYNGKNYLPLYQNISAKDVLAASLVGSDNTATNALAKLVRLTETEYVERMNNLASELGLNDSHFTDLTGLSADNKASARDVAWAYYQVSREPILRPYLAANQWTLTSTRSPITVNSTNEIYRNNYQLRDFAIEGGKTGYIPAAGYCFVSQFVKDDHEILVVVLGADSKPSRFEDSLLLADWAYDSFIWP